MRWAGVGGWGLGPAVRVSYETQMPVEQRTGVVSGPLGASPGAPRSEEQSGRGTGAAGEGGLSSRLAESGL